jgi:hypothetical protein
MSEPVKPALGVKVNGPAPVIAPPFELSGPTDLIVTAVPVSLATSVAPENVTGAPGVLPSESVTAAGHVSVLGEGGTAQTETDTGNGGSCAPTANEVPSPPVRRTVERSVIRYADISVPFAVSTRRVKPPGVARQSPQTVEMFSDCGS